MKNNASIAILLAAYNSEKFIETQIDSILNQSNTDWTLYIRNDGSTDRTGEIISQYCAMHYGKIIQIDENGTNLGCRDNFFKLLEEVESNYYMFSDADDYWLPQKIDISFGKIKELESQFPERPIIVHTDTSIVDAEMNLIADSNWDLKNLDPDIFSTPELFPIYPCIGGATMLFNKMTRDASVPIRPTLRMYDPYVAVNVIKNGVIRAINIPLLKYRQHENNMYGAFNGEDKKSVDYFSRAKLKYKENKVLYSILTSENYGSFFKFLYYKIKVALLIRKMQRYGTGGASKNFRERRG